MSAIDRLLKRLGYAKLDDYGLLLTAEDRVLATRPRILDDGMGGRLVGWKANDLASSELEPWHPDKRSVPRDLAFPVALGMARPMPVPFPLPVPESTPAPQASAAPAPEHVEPSPEPESEEDDWEWQIAAARARAQPVPVRKPATDARKPPRLFPRATLPPMATKTSTGLPIHRPVAAKSR